MRLKRNLQRTTLAALALGVAAAAWSQDKYPSKPIRLVVALAPGAGADALARFLAAEPLRRELGTEVIVENRAGAGGILGGDYLAKQKPDGYTLALFHASVVSTVTVINPNLPYNPIRDFTPVANLVTNPLAIVVSAGSRWTSLEQMIDESKKAPGKVACGIIGAGSHTHFNLELLKLASGADITRVPYSGGTGPIITDMLGGHLDCTSLVWPAVESLVKAGKFRALAATSAMKNFPQVPTFASKGYPQASLDVFFAVFGPAGLPPDVMAKLAPAFERTMKNPAVTEKLEQMGFAIQYQNAAQLAERVKHELALVADVAKKAGIKGE
jgi:tripartite-type tricarboxylate transporter receptor subunit TctC